jgi:AcrR family transcriptional regulator
MSKGRQTREQILTEAVGIASTHGLDGVTIGNLAKRLSLSKSGLFAHFRSKERLQIAIMETADDQFVQHVVLPSIRQPRGEPRVVALFENWLAWGSRDGLPGGCLFVAASSEFDDRPGAVRDHLVSKQHAWMGTLSKAVRLARDEGHFKAEVDPEQIAFEAYSIMLGVHLTHRLLSDADAIRKARVAFDALLQRIRI